MFRIFPFLIGFGLAALWVIGMSVDATVWLVWPDGVAAVLCFAMVGFVPARRGSPLAGFGLATIAIGLAALWLVGLAQQATPWLTWWTFLGACLIAVTAAGVTLQGLIDGVRARDSI